MQGTFTSESAEDTEAIGARLAGGLRPGEIVLLVGELGAGKTTLVRGAARALGVTVPVTSPTFTIGQRYPARDGLVVSHLDLYRLGSLADEDPDLLDDYLGEGRIGFVEWPGEEASTLAGFARTASRVELAHAGGDRRVVTVRAGGAR